MLDPQVPAAAAITTLLLIEYGVGRYRGKQLYSLPDTLSDIGSSLGQMAVLGAIGVTLVALYGRLVDAIAVVHLPMTVLGWLVGWLFIELILYWRHRLGHETALLWTIHQVHHQSPHYNLAVAQRVGYFQWLQTAGFLVPLALVGMPLPMFVALFAGIHFYQFLIHTQLVDRLGPLEWVLMTPSHHRAHHGRNAEYIDKNYGFSLVLYDRLFGTFVPETVAPEYGTLADLPSWNPIDNNLRPWRELWQRMRRAPNLATSLAVPFRNPAFNEQTGKLALPTPGFPVPPRRLPPGGATGQRSPIAFLFIAIAAIAALALAQFTLTWSVLPRLLAAAFVLTLTAAATAVATRASRD